MNQTILYTADVGCLADKELYNKALAAVPPSRREKIGRYHFDRDKYLSLGAFSLLRHALAERGIPMPPDFSVGENGKPYIENVPVHFNLSHSGTFALCAVSDHEVGCDIERIARADLKIAKRFFTASEYASILAAPTEDEQNIVFFRLWTLKESFLKVTGQGMRLPLDSFEITRNDHGVIRVRQSFDDKQYRFETYDGIDGYAAAVCVIDDNEIEWRKDKLF